MLAADYPLSILVIILKSIVKTKMTALFEEWRQINDWQVTLLNLSKN